MGIFTRKPRPPMGTDPWNHEDFYINGKKTYLRQVRDMAES